jgi:hypothetical protein
MYVRSLISVDLATGDRAAHAVAEPAGPIGWPLPVLADTRRNRLLVGEFPEYAIGAVDLSFGTSDIFGKIAPTELGALQVDDLIPDHASDRVLVVNGYKDVYMMDLQTGEQVLLLHSSP